MQKVTVVLNGYRRPDYLMEQVQAIKAQSVPTEILYWHNHTNIRYDSNVVNNLSFAVSNRNWGVWARFAFALNARTEYVCLFDDDTIPGSDWLLNCIETHKTHEGLLGTIGLWFEPDYRVYRRVGWDKYYVPGETTEQVDIVGHSWFFTRDLLSVYWREMPPIDWNFRVGEDIHFSYMLQKYTKYKTWVPPHPIDNRSLWGSLKAVQYGNDRRSTSSEEIANIVQALEIYRSKGFRTMYEERNTPQKNNS